MRIARVLSFAVCCGALSLPVSAQERGDVGITIGFPAAVGVLWHVNDSVAIRPDFRFSGSSTEPGGSDSRTYALGVSGLFYQRAADNVRTYVAPRLDYQDTSSTLAALGIEQTRDSSAWGVSGSFGVQYTPNRRFGVFGEIGLSYSRLTTEAVTTIFPEGTGHGWGTRAGVGIIFYPGS